MNRIKIAASVVAVFLLICFVSEFISFNNTEVELRNGFSQKMDERTAFYDKMWKTFSQKGQIAVKNDSSFRQNVNIIMDGRKDAQQVVMKWVTETNPNANYSEVAALYKDLSRAIESQRDGFFNQEKMAQDFVLQHNNLIGRFPGSIYAWLLSKEPLKYKPITSDRTDDVVKTGKDNDVKVF